jgi:hypothetical protein
MIGSLVLGNRRVRIRSVFTLGLLKAANGWRIVGWSWAKK